MSETSDKAKAAAKLEEAKRKAEKLQALQEEAAREVAEAEAAEAARIVEREAAKEKRAKEALHRAAEKQRLREQEHAAAQAAKAMDDGQEGDVELGDYVDEPLDDLQAEMGDRRKRIGLHCFNCNRMEGHYLLFYRRAWYSYLIGLTFGLAVIAGPYRCQCCGAARFMMSNLLHPKYYLSLFSTRSKRRSSRR